MKKIMTIISFLVLNHLSNAQTDSIPNAGFESWLWIGWFTNPEGWTTNNSQIMINTVIPDTDSHSGSLAMKMVNGNTIIPYAACGFDITEHPLALSGYTKNQLFNNDSAMISIHIYNSGVLVDSGYQVVYGGINPNYTSFSVPVTQNSASADSCVIRFWGGTVYQSSVTYDDLYLSFPSGISVMNDEQLFLVMPNPVHDFFYVLLNADPSNEATVTIHDLEGRLVAEEKIIAINSRIMESFAPVHQANEVYVGTLPAGAYLLTVLSGEKQYSQLIIKE